MGKNNKDTLTKAYIQDARIFADIMDYLLYDGREVIRPENLREIDTTAISVPYGAGDAYLADQRYRDVLKCLSVKTDGRVTYLILGVENQSETHFAMPVRNMIYDAQQYGKQVAEAAKSHRRMGKQSAEDGKSADTSRSVDEKEGPDVSVLKTDFRGLQEDLNEEILGARKKQPNAGEFLSGFWKGDKLIPVVTLVLHFSSKPWEGPVRLHDMMAIQDDEVLSYVADYKINLLSPAQMEDEEICRLKTDLREVLLYIKYSADEDKLNRLLEEEGQRFKAMSREGFRAMNAVTGSKLKYDDKDEVIDVCKAIDDMRNRSWNEGRNVGIELGEKEGEERVNRLHQRLITENRIDDLKRSVNDKTYQNQLMKEYELI